MVRILALMAAGSLLALSGAHSPAGARASGPGGEFDPWNPAHLTSLPQDVQDHIARLCGGAVRAGHDFARYLNEDRRHFVVLHFEHLRCEGKEFCSAQGCLHQVYLSTGGRYRLAGSRYVPEAGLEGLLAAAGAHPGH